MTRPKIFVTGASGTTGAAVVFDRVAARLQVAGRIDAILAKWRK